MAMRRPVRGEDQQLVVLRVSARTYASDDGEQLVMHTSYSPDMAVEATGDTPAEVTERFRHVLEEAAQRKLGGTWLAVLTTDDPFRHLPVTQSPEFAHLPLDALARALATGTTGLGNDRTS
jgi:hypothetical protein